MTYARKEKGRLGEEIALHFLEGKGFCLLEKNWLHRLGEIDLIVERGGEVHFVEVKLRRSLAFGYPEASITPTKLRHMARAIEMWIFVQKGPPIRYQADAVAVLLLPNAEPDIVWIEGIL